MKHFAKFGCGLLAVMMAACSSEEPIPANGNGSGEGAEKDVYATLTLKLPTASGSRAYGDVDPEFEVGKDVENNVGRVLVVLATKNADGQYQYLTRAVSDAKVKEPLNEAAGVNTVQYVLNFSSAEMARNPLQSGSNIPSNPNPDVDRNKVYVFVYCNPSERLINNFADNISMTNRDFVDIVANINDPNNAEMWQDNNFLMTNWKIVEEDMNDPDKSGKNGYVLMPTREELVSQNGKPESPFNLGTVEVKRAAARFDFMTTTVDEELGANVYPINDIDGVTPIGTVELTDMAMFNIAKSFYYLPRTSNNWDWENGVTTICSGLEEEFGYADAAKNNYVVSNNDNYFKQEKLNASTLSGYFFYSIYNNPLSTTSLKWVSLKNWNDRDNADNPNWNKPETHDYRIWRYATENTIPAYREGSSTYSQRAGITTGVVFRGEFKPNDTEVWNGIVYVYNDMVYGNYERLREYIEKSPNSNVAAAVKNSPTFGTEDENGVYNPKDPNGALTEADEAAGFKVYTPNAEGKYVMYYYYYNRHFNNGKPSVMGTNEFGVVRNNVYKLKVTKCGTLGNPKTPKPEDPNEEENAYFTVSCIVLPWTVRINNIEF